MSSIFDAFDGVSAGKAEDQQVNGLLNAYKQGSGLIGQGNDALTTQYGAALAPFLTNLKQTQTGQTKLGNLLGLNGAAGNQAARNTLEATPGYKFALDTGAQNVQRNAAAGGNLVSGNTLAALQAQGQGQAEQTTGQLINALEPYLGASNAAASGAANVDTGLGNNLNQNYNNLAGLAYGTQTGIGNAQANGTNAAANSFTNGLSTLSSGLPGLGTFLGGFTGAGGTGLGGLGASLAAFL